MNPSSRHPTWLDSPLTRWFLALELVVGGWVLWQTRAEAGVFSATLVRNVCAYALLSALAGSVLVIPWIAFARRRGPVQVAMLAGPVMAIVIGPELILALAHGPLPTRLAQPQLRLVYLGGLVALLVLGFLLHGIGRRLRVHRWIPSSRWLLAAWALIALTFAATAAVVMARGTPARPSASGVRPPDIVLVVVDALRSRALGTYGSTLGVSPHLDALAGEGVVLEACFSVATTSVPGHAGILFGADVREHLALTNQHDAPASLPSLAEQLRQRGYRTLGVCRNQLISRSAGFARGFDFYWSSGRRALDQAPLPFVALSLAHVQIVGQLLDVDWVSLYARTLMRWLDDRPTFLFLQFLHCHQPYRDGNRWATPEHVAEVLARYREGRFHNRSEYDDEEVARFHARYLGSVQYVDSLVGALRDQFEATRGDGVVWMITADHGENLAEHAGAKVGEHGGYYDTSIRVPWIAAGGGLPAGYRSGVLTGHDRIEDLTLRIVDEATPPTPQEVDAVAVKQHHFVYSEPFAMALDDSLKLVLDESNPAVLDSTQRADPALELPGAPLVFAWREDAQDAHPLVSRRDERVRALWRIVVESTESLREAGALEPPASMDPKRLEALRALGYVD